MSTAHIRNTDVSIAQDKRPINGAPTTHTTYRIDPAASRVEFTIGKRLFFVMHLMVTGRFTDVEGTINFDEQEPANSRAEVTIAAASVDTRMGKRDQHLRKTDFFDVARHPRLTFDLPPRQSHLLVPVAQRHPASEGTRALHRPRPD
jgi:polyisoprenoid-binding protein YceI